MDGNACWQPVVLLVQNTRDLLRASQALQADLETVVKLIMRQQTVFWMLKWLASPPQVCAGPLLLVGLAGATWVWRLVDRLKPSLQRQESTPSLSSKALKSSLVKPLLVESDE
jgi:hypothetical protein